MFYNGRGCASAAVLMLLCGVPFPLRSCAILGASGSWMAVLPSCGGLLLICWDLQAASWTELLKPMKSMMVAATVDLVEDRCSLAQVP